MTETLKIVRLVLALLAALCFMLAFSVHLWAQQIASPSQLAVQIDGAVGVLATRAENAEAQVKALQDQIEQLKRELQGKTHEAPK